MSGSKQTTVLLVVPKFGIQQDFALDHAERILRMPNNGGWELPEDSNFELTENGLACRRNKKGNKGKQEGAGNLESESASEQD